MNKLDNVFSAWALGKIGGLRAGKYLRQPFLETSDSAKEEIEAALAIA